MRHKHHHHHHRSRSDYKLVISAGPSLDALQVLNVNHEDKPTWVSSPHFQGYVMVRMKDYPSECPTGTPLKDPPSNYFASKQRLYSISIQGTFTRDHNGNELLWELDLSRPIKAPYGSGVALRIAKWLEPSLEYDLDASEPFMNAPLISTMSALGVYKKDDFVKEFKDEFSKSKYKASPSNSASISPPNENSPPWAFSSNLLPENTQRIVTNNSFKSIQERKKYFANASHRSDVTVKGGDVVCMEFYDAHFDFNQMRLMLPGFSLNVFKLWDDHLIRFSCKSRDKKETYFVVVFELVKLPRPEGSNLSVNGSGHQGESSAETSLTSVAPNSPQKAVN